MTATQPAFEHTVEGHVRSFSGRAPQDSTVKKFWTGLSAATVEQIADNWAATRNAYKNTRRASYFSAEFLEGRALLNNLTNLGLVDKAKAIAEENGFELSDVLEAEHDAALGNGGLGRLAACFLDSAAEQDFPLTGYGLLYRYGLFRQEFEDGFQREHPDAWKESFYPFIIRRGSEQRIVKFDDMHVRAIPYDMPITGYGTDNVGTLRLWDASPIAEFDYDAFNSQRFADAILEREAVHDITRVLYPNDSTYAGKLLRVRQQYFFASASLQELIDDYIAAHGEDLRDFHKYNSIQLNDTHPVLGIPELMRLLMDEHGIDASDLHDFYPARTSPPPSGTWDVRLDGEALAQAERSVCEALDEFDTAPPATVQRLAELVLRPTYTTRSKYLAALERVVRVSGTLRAYDAAGGDGDGGDGDASDAALDPPWAQSRAASAEAEPIFSPIPFLHGGADAPEDAPTQRAAGLAAPGDAEAVYRVPEGRVDELDTAEAPETHGGVADRVAPLSAATSVPDEGGGAKRVRSEAR